MTKTFLITLSGKKSKICEFPKMLNHPFNRQQPKSALKARQLCGSVPVGLTLSFQMRPLPVVDAHVFGQRSARREAFPANVAQVRLLPRVGPHVDLQRALLVELLVT